LRLKDGNGKTDTTVLCWPGRLLSEEDLRRHLTSQSEILLAPRTVITPLALDHLRDKGVRIRRQETAVRAASVSERSGWRYAEAESDALVKSALASLEHEGLALRRLTETTPLAWAKAAATVGVVVFCRDAGLCCCVANKIPGVRAVAVGNVAQTKRARETLAPNLFVVETPGPTFHELRQIVRAATTPASCPADIAKTLQELDRHAHR
jgi:hypothetical protein